MSHNFFKKMNFDKFFDEFDYELLKLCPEVLQVPDVLKFLQINAILVIYYSDKYTRDIKTINNNEFRRFLIINLD